jgi:hypothetical protein
LKISRHWEFTAAMSTPRVEVSPAMYAMKASQDRNELRPGILRVQRVGLGGATQPADNGLPPAVFHIGWWSSVPRER